MIAALAAAALLVLAAPAGEVLPVGGAPDHGDLSGLAVSSSIVGMAASSSGGGYWLVAADGGVFAFGDAEFLGSGANIGFDRPVVGFTSADDDGYAMVSADGAFAGFSAVGSSVSGSECRADPVTGFTPNPGGDGWWVTTSPLPPPWTVPSAASSPTDSAAIDELLSFAQACQGDVIDPPAASLSSPVPGARLSSSFGSRVHPIWGVRQLHDRLRAPVHRRRRGRAGGGSAESAGSRRLDGVRHRPAPALRGPTRR